MNITVITEPPKFLEIGKKTEVQVEVDEVGSIRTSSMLVDVRKVGPRDILKLEQKRNNRRNDEKVFAESLGWGAGVSFQC